MYRQLKRDYKKERYVVGSEGKIIFETTSTLALGAFENTLCEKYEEDHEGSHEVYIQKNDKFFYSHATWFDGKGEVSSRGVRPIVDQTKHFKDKYGDMIREIKTLQGK